MLVEESGETVVLVPFIQVSQLMHQDVLQALHGLLGQLQIQPDAPGPDVAGAPSGLHPFDVPGQRFASMLNLGCHFSNIAGSRARSGHGHPRGGASSQEQSVCF